MSWLALLRRTRSISRAEGLVFGQAWMILLAADVSLRLLPFPSVERLFMPRCPAASSEKREETVSRCAWATGAAARHHLWPMRCLPSSLCLRWLLGRAGLPAQLRLGVARDAGRLLAHAWVELDGRPVGEAEERIAPFAPLSEIRTDN